MNELRWALYFLRYYILTCRFAEEKGSGKKYIFRLIINSKIFLVINKLYKHYHRIYMNIHIHIH
jgi:hypothetical protein